MRVRFAVVSLLLLAALAHGDQQAAAKSAGMVMIIISQLHIQRILVGRLISKIRRHKDILI